MRFIPVLTSTISSTDAVGGRVRDAEPPSTGEAYADRPAWLDRPTRHVLRLGPPQSPVARSGAAHGRRRWRPAGRRAAPPVGCRHRARHEVTAQMSGGRRPLLGDRVDVGDVEALARLGVHHPADHPHLVDRIEPLRPVNGTLHSAALGARRRRPTCRPTAARSSVARTAVGVVRPEPRSQWALDRPASVRSGSGPRRAVLPAAVDARLSRS